MSKTILCVDDEIDILELLVDELEDEGFQTLQALGYKEALDVLAKNKVDCVISDIKMPDGSGVELAKEIVKTNKIPVYLITGFNDYSLEELKSIGVTSLFMKPFDFTDVVSSIKSSLEA